MSYPCPHCGIDTALAFPGPADEVVIDGKRWRVIPSGFGYDDGSQSCRLVPTEVAQDQVDWRAMALRVKHEGLVRVRPEENPDVPVPLTDIEALAANPGVVGYVPVGDVGALCEALRIAVEGLTRVGRNNHSDVAADALAAVRELVDLGEKP